LTASPWSRDHCGMKHHIPGIWRLSIAACSPVSIGVLSYFWLIVPPLYPDTRTVYVAEVGYRDFRDAKVVYNSHWLGNQPFGTLDDVKELERKGYFLVATSDWSITVYRSPKLPLETLDKVGRDLAELQGPIAREQLQAKVARFALWTGFAVLPFLVFAASVFVGRWVRAGFKAG
jgi:hypothetical protein